MQEAKIDQLATTIGIRAVLVSTWTLLKRHPLGLLAGAIGMAAIDSAFDIMAPDASASFISSVTSIGVVYVVFRLLLQKEGMIEREGGFGSYFGASLLSSLAVLVGLVLLVVPGLYLMGRWSLSSAMVVAKGMKATDALRASWQATEACVWEVVLLYVMFFGGFFAGVVILGASAGFLSVMLGRSVETVDSSPIFIIVLNFAANLGVVASSYLSVALFRHVAGRDRGLEQVFA